MRYGRRLSLRAQFITELYGLVHFWVEQKGTIENLAYSVAGLIDGCEDNFAGVRIVPSAECRGFYLTSNKKEVVFDYTGYLHELFHEDLDEIIKPDSATEDVYIVEFLKRMHVLCKYWEQEEFTDISQITDIKVVDSLSGRMHAFVYTFLQFLNYGASDLKGMGPIEVEDKYKTSVVGINDFCWDIHRYYYLACCQLKEEAIKLREGASET